MISISTLVLTNYDFNQNQLLHPVIHVASSAPGSPVVGQVYYNSTSNIMFYWNGSAWTEMDSGAPTFGSVTAQTSFGASSGNGSATTVSRSDHTHGTPSLQGTASGNISLNGAYKVTSSIDPTSPQDLATKNYVDSVANGLTWKPAVQLATAGALAANTYSNGTNGLGATLTGTSNGALTVDGSTSMWVAQSGLAITACTFASTTITVTVSSNAGMAVGQPINITGITGFTTNNPNGEWTVASLVSTNQFTFTAALAPTGTYGSGGTITSAAARILVQNEATQANNGIYTVTQVGTGSLPYVLTRATDMDTAVATDTNLPKYDGATVFVEYGTANAKTQWACTNIGGVNPGTTAVVFAQIGASSSYSADETTLHLSGSQFSIKSTYAGQNSITTLGTITTGTWTGTTIAVLNGGTGATTAAAARTNLSSNANPLPQYFTAAIGNGSSTSITVTHNLGNQFPVYRVYQTASTYNAVECDVSAATTNTMTFTFAVAPTSNQYTVAIVG